MALIRLRICAGWSEPLRVTHFTLLEISCRGSYDYQMTKMAAMPMLGDNSSKTVSRNQRGKSLGSWYEIFLGLAQESVRILCGRITNHPDVTENLLSTVF